MTRLCCNKFAFLCQGYLLSSLVRDGPPTLQETAPSLRDQGVVWREVRQRPDVLMKYLVPQFSARCGYEMYPPGRNDFMTTKIVPKLIVTERAGFFEATRHAGWKTFGRTLAEATIKAK